VSQKTLKAAEASWTPHLNWSFCND